MRPSRITPTEPPERVLNVTLLLIAGIALLMTVMLIGTVFGLWLKLFWFGWVMAGH